MIQKFSSIGGIFFSMSFVSRIFISSSWLPKIIHYKRSVMESIRCRQECCDVVKRVPVGWWRTHLDCPMGDGSGGGGWPWIQETCRDGVEAELVGGPGGSLSKVSHRRNEAKKTSHLIMIVPPSLEFFFGNYLISSLPSFKLLETFFFKCGLFEATTDLKVFFPNIFALVNWHFWELESLRFSTKN